MIWKVIFLYVYNAVSKNDIQRHRMVATVQYFKHVLYIFIFLFVPITITTITITLFLIFYVLYYFFILPFSVELNKNIFTVKIFLFKCYSYFITLVVEMFSENITKIYFQNNYFSAFKLSKYDIKTDCK